MNGVLEPRVLEELAEDVGVPAARRFAVQYRRALDWRLDRLRWAAADGHVAATYEAAVGLATASAMVGATPLARAAWEVTRDVVRDGVLPRPATLATIERLVRDTGAALDHDTTLQAGEPDPG